MDVVGWSTVTTAQRYMHVTEALRRDVADQVNGYFWRANETENETDERSSRAGCVGTPTGSC
jgi:hypothetical protein